MVWYTRYTICIYANIEIAREHILMRFLQCFAASSIHLRSSRRRARVQSLVQLWKAACKVQNAIAKSELRTFTFFSTDLQYLSLMQFAVCFSIFSWCNDIVMFSYPEQYCFLPALAFLQYLHLFTSESDTEPPLKVKTLIKKHHDYDIL